VAQAEPVEPVETAAEPSTPARQTLPPVVGVIESVTLQAGEVLEEFDYADMAQLMGHAPEPPTDAAQAPASDEAPAPSAKPRRPIASDIPVSETPASASTSWRRKSDIDVRPGPAAASTSTPLPIVIEPKPVPPAEPPAPHSAGRPHPLPLSPQTKSPLLPHGALRSPRSPTFREAPMAALDDTMSRIRGALDGMQPRQPLAPVPENAPAPDAVAPVKSAPPAPRPRLVLRPTETFATREEVPASPKKAWGAVTLAFPKERHRHRPPLDKKQARFAREPPGHVRWEILSFTPPVAGMNQKTLAVNEVLFPRQFLKGQIRYTVALPKPRKLREKVAESEEGGALVVNLPSKQRDARAPGVFSDLTYWMHAEAAAGPRELSAASPDGGLNIVSRSPVPDVEVSRPPADASADSARARAQPKMPEGSAIAFYRQPEAEVVAPSVSFTVSSELDGSHHPSASASASVPVVDVSGRRASVSRLRVQSKPCTHSRRGCQDDAQAPSESAHPDDAASQLRTSPTKTSATPPDPEYLRAVWSQVSAKSDIPASNSLKSINDDLTGIPFTLQDVKSEDGGTPPGSGAPSRMSIHDVTRAFQQVPSSTTTPSPAQGATSPSPKSSGHLPRRPSYGFPSPSMPASRPLYSPYPPPNNMVAPASAMAPAPAMMYPPSMSPGTMARPMPNGHIPPYPPQPQQMWYPVPVPMAHSPVPGAPGAPVHVMHSPYPPQMMGYAPVGPYPGMYTPPPPPPPVPGTPPGRGRGAPLVPPVVTQAAPGVYPHQSYPSPITPGRGHPVPPGQHPMASPRAPPTNLASFNPVPPSYVRAPW
jgi:serine/arginine repetitive matrix protein 2